MPVVFVVSVRRPVVVLTPVAIWSRTIWSRLPMAVSIARRRGKFAPPGLLSLVCPHRGVQAYHARLNGEAHLVFGISSLHIKKCARTSQQLVSYRVAATVDREWPTLARTHARRSVSGASGARVNLIVFLSLTSLLSSCSLLWQRVAAFGKRSVPSAHVGAQAVSIRV